MTSTGWQQSLLGNGAVQRARPLPRHLHRLANLYCNINNIRVRSFILTGAPKIHGSLSDASLPGGYLIAQ
jgi:hypothetical protein